MISSRDSQEPLCVFIMWISSSVFHCNVSIQMSVLDETIKKHFGLIKSNHLVTYKFNDLIKHGIQM